LQIGAFPQLREFYGDAEQNDVPNWPAQPSRSWIRPMRAAAMEIVPVSTK